MQSRFPSLPHSQIEFVKNSDIFCCRAALWPACRKPPIDGVLAPVECSGVPIEPDRQEGFEKLAENDWFAVLKVVDEYCSQERRK